MQSSTRIIQASPLPDSEAKAEQDKGLMLGTSPDPVFWSKKREGMWFKDQELFTVVHGEVTYYYRAHDEGEWWRLQWPD